MRRFRAAWFVSVVALALLTLAAPMLPPAAAQAPGTLVLGLDQEPPTLDPHASPSAVTYQIIASVTENLVYKGPDGKLVPWLAESWTASKDGRSVTFKLRRDVKFHDGTPFNADAVKFNFDRIVDPKFKAGGARAALAGYAGSKVLDEYSVQVSFETPFAPFLTYAASGPLSLVSPKAVRETGDQVHTKPIGTGQFMIKEYVAKDHTTMVRDAGLQAEAAVERAERPRPARDGGLEVHPRGGDPRDHAGERRDAGRVRRPGPVAAPARGEHRAADREGAVAGRAAHLAAQRHQAPDGRREGATRDQPRHRQGRLPGHRLQGHGAEGQCPADRRDAR